MNIVFKVSAIVYILAQIADADQDYDEMTDEENEIYYKAAFSDIGCLFQIGDTNLDTADAMNFTFPDHSIYFIETSCRGGLDFRQACSVETAARAHPDRQINVLFAGRSTARDNTTQKYLNSLLNYTNVKFYKIHLYEYSKGTPLENLVTSELRKSDYLMYHTSDVLRFLTLYKFGGIYLDLDVFIVKSLDLLPIKRNWVGRDISGLAVGLVALAKTGVGKELIHAILKNLDSDFRTDVWGANGIGVITKAVQQVCKNQLLNITAANCRGFKIYDPRYFYSIKSEDYKEFLEPINGSLNLTKVYAFHLWNYLLYGEDIPRNSLHTVLTRKYCPNIHKSSRKPGYDSNYSSPSPPKIRIIDFQRSKVNPFYENNEINFREEQLNKDTSHTSTGVTSGYFQVLISKATTAPEPEPFHRHLPLSKNYSLTEKDLISKAATAPEPEPCHRHLPLSRNYSLTEKDLISEATTAPEPEHFHRHLPLSKNYSLTEKDLISEATTAPEPEPFHRHLPLSRNYSLTEKRHQPHKKHYASLKFVTRRYMHC